MNTERNHIQEEKYRDYDPFLNLKCKNCNEIIPSANININKTLAKCEHCERIFTFEDDVFFENKRGRPEFIMPEGTEILKLLSSMEIELSWFKSMKRSNIAFETMFTLLWNLFIVIIMVAMITTGSMGALFFLALHFVVGLGLGYRLFAKFINKTIININDSRVKMDHGPLKIGARKDHTIQNEDIEQLYVSEYVTNMSKNNQPIKSFGLYLILKSGKKLQLIKDCNKETALYIEQEMERYLKIKDKPVVGEILK